MELCKLLLLFTILAFSLFLSSLAAPHASRSLEGIRNTKAVRESQYESAMDVGEQRGILLEEDDEPFSRRGRMGMEEDDYSGTGANPRHDPNPPGSTD